MSTQYGQQSRRSSVQMFSLKLLKRLPAFLLILVILSAVGLWHYLMQSQTLPFRKVTLVVSSNHIQLVKLQSIVKEHLNGGFFSINQQQLRAALLALPWVYHVGFSRVWPDQLVISVVEQTPLANWNHRQLVNQQGHLFAPDMGHVSSALPLLLATADDQLPVVLAEYKKINKQLSAIGLRITQLSLSSRLAWQLIVDHHMNIMLGRRDIARRLQRFIQLYPEIIANNESKVKTVDLRYPNGLAIQWE